MGADENADKSIKITGVHDPDDLIKKFWDAVNNRLKVNINILRSKNVYSAEIDGKSVVVIEVPRALRQDKPIYINGDMNKGTYRRNGEGDYHCTASEIKNMVRDSADVTQDRIILENMSTDALDMDTVARYRMQFSNLKPGHVWEKIFVDDFLSKIGAVRRSDNDGMLHPTAAGLLMFGSDTEIVNEFPNYFLDYREAFGEDADERWRDRVTSGTGDWSGNLYDFYYRIRDRLTSDLKVPFMLLNGKDRIDETKMHKALHEALANALIHSDYYERRGIVIDKKKTGVVISNPGALRISKDEALNGGVSDPRNGALFLMFSLIGIGERAGSGLMNIETVWKEKGLPRPILTERFNPDRTTLILPFGKENGNLNTESVRLSEDQTKVIELLRNGPLSAAELMSGMSYAFSLKTFHISILLPLKEAGYIGLTIPDRPNSKNQKYCVLSMSDGSG